MLKVVTSVFCFYSILQIIFAQSLTKATPGCEPGTCCVPNICEPLTSGETKSDPNGLCQYYQCNEDGSFWTYGCPTIVNCETEAGTPGALYPDCCEQKKEGVKQPAGCYAIA